MTTTATMRVAYVNWYDEAPSQIVTPLVTIDVPARRGWSALIEDRGLRYYLSKLEGESGWTLDGFWRGGAVPVFQHGWGYRCDTPATQITDPNITAALDSAVAAAA